MRDSLIQLLNLWPRVEGMILESMETPELLDALCRLIGEDERNFVAILERQKAYMDWAEKETQRQKDQAVWVEKAARTLKALGFIDPPPPKAQDESH